MNTKAIIECEIPNLATFEVRGNIPLPAGYNIDDSLQLSPFTVVAPDGTELQTQCDVVTRAPNGETTIVQVMAKAYRKSLPVGSRQSFKVIESEQSDPWVAPLPPVKELLFVPDQVKLRGEDALGNIYEAALHIVEGDGVVRNITFGQVRTAVEVARPLVPVIDDQGFSHLGGMQAVLIMRNDDTNVVELNLSWYNGIVPNPLPDLYFKTLEIVIPTGWNVRSEWHEPFMSDAYDEGDSRVIPLIRPNDDDSMHLLLQKDNRDWRLYLFLDGKEYEAQEIAEHKSWGTVQEGAENGERYWSWHNPVTANYQSQRAIMPKLDHTANLENVIRDRQETIYFNLATGQPYADSGGGTGQIGYRNPAGVQYGGMTGGMEINEWEGTLELAAGIKEGLLFRRALSRMYSDRQRGGYIFEEDGSPIKMDDYLNPNGSTPWTMFNSTFQQQSWPYGHLQDDAPFNFGFADQSQIEYVQSNDLAPSYEGAMRDYDPIDDQHLIRRMKDLSTLVYLDNDYASKRHIIMHCETIRMTYSETTNGRLANLRSAVLSNPHNGGGWGRAEAHIINAAAMGYAITSDQWRSRWNEWFNSIYDITITMQGQNGIWNRQFGGKVITNFDFAGQYSAQRPNEHELMIHAVRSLVRSVFEGRDPSKAAALEASLAGGIIGTWIFLWKWNQDNSGPDGHGWWDTVAMGSLAPSSPMWMNHSEHPVEQYVVPEDSFHVPVVLGYGMEQYGGTSAEPTMRRVVATHLESSDLLTTLENQGLQAMTNRAHLLAVLQELDG